MRSPSKGCIASTLETATAIRTKPFSRSGIASIRVLPPIGKQKRYPALTLTVIHAEERGAPKNRKKIDWKLITDLPVQSRKDAIEKLEWYALRWKIEVFHKILKSGCKAEEAKLRTAERLANLISVFLHPELAGVLDDDDQPFSPCAAEPSP